MLTLIYGFALVAASSAAGLFGFFVGRCARRLPVIDDNLPWTLHRSRFPEGLPQREAWPTKSAMPSMMRCRPNRKERAASWAAPYSAPAAAPTRTAVG